MSPESLPHRRLSARKLWRIRAALSVALLALIGGTLLFARQLAMTAERVERQLRIGERAPVLNDTLLSLTSAEIGQRGFLLTGNRRYLETYQAAIDRLPGLLRAVEERGVRETEFAPTAQEIRSLARARMVALARSIELEAQGRHAAALALVQADADQHAMERLQLVLRDALINMRAELAGLGASIVADGRKSAEYACLTAAALAVSLVLASIQLRRLLRDRSTNEAELARSQRQLRSILEEQQELISLSDRGGKLIYVNPAYAAFFGSSVERLVGTSLYDLIGEKDRETVRARMARVLESGQAYRSEGRFRSSDGERWIAWRVQRRQGPDGAFYHHAVGRDTTDRRRTEDALKASEEFLRQTGRVAGVGGWAVDLASKTMTWSDAVRAILEVPSGDVPRLSAARAFCSGQGRKALKDAIVRSRRTGQAWNLVLPMTTCRGRAVFVRCAGELVRDDAGRPLRFIGALQDVTEQKELEQRLAESERLLRQVTNASPIQLGYLDREGRFRFANQALARRYGKTPSEVQGRLRAELAAETGMTVNDQRVEAALGGVAQHFEFTETGEAGVRQIEADLTPDFDEHGQVRGVYTTGVDVTSRNATERALRELADIFEASPDAIVQTDQHGNFTYLNRVGRRALGLGPSQSLAGLQHTEFHTPETAAVFSSRALAQAHEKGSWMGETTIAIGRGRVLPVNHLLIAHKSEDGAVERYSAFIRDISVEIAARKALRLQTATLTSVVEAIPAMVAVYDARCRYRLVNRAFETWAGVRRARCIGLGMREVFDAEEFAQSWPWAEKATAGETVSFEKVVRKAQRSRHVSVSYVPLRLDDGSVDGFLEVGQDITQQREEANRLARLSELDPLTSLRNRAGMEAHLRHCLADGKGDSLAILYADLDRFKPVNDQHGHAAGDEVLRQFAQRILGVVRPSDAAARLGGDEFVVVLSGVRSLADAQKVAEKLVAASKQPYEVFGGTVHVGASVGVAHGIEPGEGWEALVDRADRGLYKAKRAGRGQIG